MDRRVRLAVWPLLALLVAVAAGIAVGWWASGVVEPVPFARPADDEWTGVLFVLALLELSETPRLVGGVVGVLTGGLVWAVGLLWVARRLLPRGRQGAPVLATLATAWLGTAVVLLVWGAARGGQEPPALPAVTLVAALVAVGSCAVFPLVARRRTRRAEAADAVSARDGESAVTLGAWFDRAQARGQGSADR